ncbi:hypothetical protein [Mesobacillus harenae]|uniref:hypothetical protein n=1 Tax=Mesobacillus harenae TaxID=2213203 RepID=UPI00157FE152|nr:hypothetical protein [Mesobacillus harenae]
METFVFALASLLLLVPIIYFIPIGLTSRGKGLLVIVSFLIAMLSLFLQGTVQLWQTLLVLLLLAVSIGYIMDKRFGGVLYAAAALEGGNEALMDAERDKELIHTENMDSRNIREPVSVDSSPFAELDEAIPEILVEKAGQKNKEEPRLPDTDVIDELGAPLNGNATQIELAAEKNDSESAHNLSEIEALLEQEDELIINEADQVPDLVLSDLEVLELEANQAETSEEAMLDEETVVHSDLEALILSEDDQPDMQQQEELAVKEGNIHKLEDELVEAPSMEEEVLVPESELLQEGHSESLEEVLLEKEEELSAEEETLMDDLSLDDDGDVLEDDLILEDGEDLIEGELHSGSLANLEELIHEDDLLIEEELEQDIEGSTHIEKSTVEEAEIEASETEEKQRKKSVLQHQLLQTMAAELHIVRDRMKPEEYEGLIKEHMKPGLAPQDYYTFASLLMNHYVRTKQTGLLEELLTDLKLQFSEFPILLMEIEFLLERVSKKPQ